MIFNMIGTPKNVGILIAGTKTECGQEVALGKQQPRDSHDEPRHGQNTGALDRAGCPMVEPPGKMTKSSPASVQLFKRVIYERAAAKIDSADGAHDARRWVAEVSHDGFKNRDGVPRAYYSICGKQNCSK